MTLRFKINVNIPNVTSILSFEQRVELGFPQLLIFFIVFGSNGWSAAAGLLEAETVEKRSRHPESWHGGRGGSAMDYKTRRKCEFLEAKP